MQAFGFAHIDQLSATTQEIGGAHAGEAERDGGRQVEGRAHAGKDTRIDAVGLGERAGGFGKRADPTRIDPGEGVSACCQRSD